MSLPNLHLYKSNKNYTSKSNFAVSSGRVKANFFLQNQDKVSFQKVNGPSEKTMKYLEAVKKFSKDNNTEISSLNELDLNKINDICAGIPVFEGWSAVDLLFATNNIDSILLSRGCYKQCAHCGASALPKIEYMKWQNFTKLVDGIEILKDRLGFNPFCKNNCDFIYPFHDSDPVDYRQTDEKGQIRTIYDASKYFYDKTGSKVLITTAGWAPENKVVQQGMENFLANPTIINKIVVSVHPFHRFMTKSIELEKQGNLEKAKIYREKYVDTMANVLKTLAPLIKRNKLFINLEFENSSNNELSKDSAKNLMLEIYQKIKSNDPDFYFIKKNETIKTLYNIGMIMATQIINEGRASELTSEKRNQLDDVTKYNLLIAKKYVDTDGTILASNQLTDLQAKFVALPKKLNFANDTRFYEEYIYPSLKESDLVYEPSEIAKKLNKALNPNIIKRFIGWNII